MESLLSNFLCAIKAMELWFHSAHHVVKGKSYAGDHELLYERIYRKINSQFDLASERVIGITESEKAVCPIRLANNAAKILSKYPTPVDANGISIAAFGLNILQDHLSMLEKLFKHLDDSGKLSLGFNDFLMSYASCLESEVYHLKQRLKESV